MQMFVIMLFQAPTRYVNLSQWSCAVEEEQKRRSMKEVSAINSEPLTMGTSLTTVVYLVYFIILQMNSSLQWKFRLPVIRKNYLN